MSAQYIVNQNTEVTGHEHLTVEGFSSSAI